MRFVTYSFRGKTQLGMMIDEDQIIDLQAVSKRYLPGSTASYLDSMQAFIEAGAKAVTTAKKAAKYVEGLDTKGIRRLAQAGLLVKRNRTRLLSPIPVPRKNVICLGVNYQEHIDEGVRARGVQLNTPEVPVFFTKPATAVIGDQGRVLAHSATDKIDWEVELAVVIGRKGRNIPRAKANDYIFGYTVCLDMTARDLQRRHLQWWKGKSLDTFCPLGPSIVHKSAMPDPKSVRLQCRVNGETMPGRQHARHDLRYPGDHRVAVRRLDPGARRHHQHGNTLGGRLRPDSAHLPPPRRQGGRRSGGHRRP